jgi:acyl carrier protein
MTTIERLREMLTDGYKIAPEKLTPEARLEDLGVDSLGVMELLFEVEDAFDIRLPSEQVKLATVGDVARYIDRLINLQRATSAAVS